MTAQMPDRLIYDGEHHPLLVNPLEFYAGPSEDRLKFESQSSANWRGYVATWQIADDFLSLVDISGTLVGGSRASMDLFLEADENRHVRALWFSGELRIAKGEMVSYVHMGYGSTFAQEFFLAIEKGAVVETRTIDRTMPDPEVDF